MRIAIYHNLPSGGGKRALYEFTRRLAAKHPIEVFTLSSADHDFADLRPLVNSYRVYEFEPLPLLRSPFGRLNQSIRTIDLHRVRRINRQIAADIEAGWL